jgi:hypothetical protein
MDKRICKESTKLAGDRSGCVDVTPRQTLGDPPKYVKRQVVCLNCVSESRSGSARLVPDNETIPSVYEKRPSAFEKTFRDCMKTSKRKRSKLSLKFKKAQAPVGPRLSRAKAPVKLRRLEANISSALESSCHPRGRDK